MKKLPEDYVTRMKTLLSDEYEEYENLNYLLSCSVTEETLEAGIGYAQKIGETEILSVLMDEKYRRFPKKKKTDKRQNTCTICMAKRLHLLLSMKSVVGLQTKCLKKPIRLPFIRQPRRWQVTY